MIRSIASLPTPLVHTAVSATAAVLLAVPAAADGKDEVEFFIRPTGVVDAGTTQVDALSASSDAELSVVGYVPIGSAQIFATEADGRGLTLAPALGGFDAPQLISGASTVSELDEEGVRVSGTTAMTAWIDGTATVVLTARDAGTGTWGAPTAVPSLPAGTASDYEFVLTRSASPVALVAAVIDGGVFITASLDGGTTWGTALTVLPAGSGAAEVELEAQGSSLGIVYTDQRGPAGERALWLRTGAIPSGTPAVTLGAEQSLHSVAGEDALQPEIAIDGDGLLVGWIGSGVRDRMLATHSLDGGASFVIPALEPFGYSGGIGVTPDAITDFDAEVTDDVFQLAVTEVVGGVSSVVQLSAFDPTFAGDWIGFVLGEGDNPRFARTETTGGEAPGAQTVVFSFGTTAGGTTVGAISADQANGTEYHDEILPVGDEGGIDPAATVERFAVAYNALYDNFIIPSAILGGAQDGLQITGYRPLSLIGEEFEAGATDARFAMGHVPFEDALLFVVISQSVGKGSFLLPDGRDTGLTFDPLSITALSAPLFNLSFVAVNVPALEGAEFANLPFAYPAGFSFEAVGVSVRPDGSIRKLTDVISIP